MATLLQLSHTCSSQAGVKPENQDACGVCVPDTTLLATKGAAAVIADGVSSAEGGREASDACVKGFFVDYFSTPESWSVKTSAQKVLAALNRWLHGTGQRKYGGCSMVTTFSAVVFKSNTAYLFHVGDTRIYRLRGDDFEQLTHDHQIQMAGDKSYLARAMGVELNIDIDYRALSICQGDLFLLTSDGVHGYLSHAAIKKIMQDAAGKLQDITDTLIRQALAQGSSDNVTALLVRIDEVPDKDEHEFYRELTRLPFPPPLSPGMKLDGYRIVRELYSNTRSEIFLAEDVDTSGRVVIKAPSVNYSDNPEYISRFLHEEWAGRRINNPHVIRCLPHTRPRQFLYTVSEYIEGRSLRQWMNDEKKPSLDKVRDIVGQVARGLQALHRLEMIHQDLKPENVMIDQNGTARIIDLGSTKIAGIEEISTPLQQDDLLGTLNYTAPEYHRGEPATHRSDIFSLGVMCYEMLTGALPFDRELESRNLNRVHYVSARNHNRDIPFWMDKALEKAVQLNPQYRYAELSEFVYDLSHPNAEFMRENQAPLLERNPVGFWRSVALIALMLNLILLYLLVK
jgi:serine/threonine protein phosphatase PrpC